MMICRAPSPIRGNEGFTTGAAGFAQQAVDAYQTRQQAGGPQCAAIEIVTCDEELSKATFNWTCAPIQTTPSESCLLKFFDKTSFHLKWDQATCSESELVNPRSLHQLLPKPHRDLFMRTSLMGHDAWDESAPNICLKQITVIPRGDINAVECVLNMVDDSDVISYFSVHCIWPNTALMTHCDYLVIDKNINLQSLLVAPPPCLVVAFPIKKIQLNLSHVAQMSHAVFINSGGQQITLTNEEIAAAILQAGNNSCYMRDVSMPCAFLLDVAENPDIELPFSLPRWQLRQETRQKKRLSSVHCEQSTVVKRPKRLVLGVKRGKLPGEHND